MRILLVGEISNGSVVAKQLPLGQWHNSELFCASGLIRARAELERLTFDLMLVDSCLPDGSGLELLSGMPEPLKATMAIFLVHQGPDDTALAQACIHAGADDCFSAHELGSRHFQRSLVMACQRQQLVNDLTVSSLEWTQAMDHFSDAIYILDTQRRLVRANRAFYEGVNTTPEQAVGKSIVELVHPGGEESPCPVCRAEMAMQDALITMEVDDINNPTGGPLEITVKVLRREGGEPRGIMLSMHDLTPSRAMEERLQLLASAFNNTAQGVFITRPSGEIIEVNQACTQLLGYQREQLLGSKPSLFKSGRHDPVFYQNLWSALLETGQWKGEIWNRRENGEVFPAWQTINAIKDYQGTITHFTSILSDLTDIRRSQEELNHLAQHDTLTDLPNRALLLKCIERAIPRAQSSGQMLALIFLDIDNFKNINDSFGHVAGDELLKALARRLPQALSSKDTLARTGGDEFVLLLEGLQFLAQVNVAAEKIMQLFAQPVTIGQHAVRVGVSLGISLFPNHGKDAITLMRNADAALYRAKARGRGNFQFYTESLTQNAMERVLMENHLRAALSRGELSLVYQGQMDVQQQRIVGVEALLRWHSSELGQISPGQFIPLAEETGLITSIGRWVLEQACAQACQWLEQGLDIGRIAVNISGLQIQRGRLLEEVKEVLAKTGLPPERLELEVTEGFIMVHAEEAIAQLDQLGKLGVALAIDDFGTGYSSLSYLKRLPVHKLKIDQSFIRDLPGDANDEAIVQTIIAMSRSMNLEVIAEGVETQEQVEFLKQLECWQAQGFLYSKPKVAKAFRRDFWPQ